MYIQIQDKEDSVACTVEGEAALQGHTAAVPTSTLIYCPK